MYCITASELDTVVPVASTIFFYSTLDDQDDVVVSEVLLMIT